MHKYSVTIRNAHIVDGTGAPGFLGDLAIVDDRITEIGRFEGTGEIEIDAGGKVLAPGFIDVHTHYDPQLCWDRMATPTPEHGVTSIVMGNCSVSLAPVRPGSSDALIRWFGSVEDMESNLLRKTVAFDWETVGEYLDKLRSGVGPNVGVFVGHAVLRFYVMGEAAQQRPATAVEIEQMAKVLREALAAGAFGLSLTYNHLDEKGGELPCMYAERDELRALLKVIADARRMVEISPNLRDGHDPVEQIDRFGELALETGATCTLSPILQTSFRPQQWSQMLGRLEYWREQGAPVFAQTQVRPLDISVVLAKGSLMLSKTVLWRQIMDMPIERKIAALKDASLRDKLADEMAALAEGIQRLVVKKTAAEANQPYIGRSLAEISRTENRRLSDTLIDIALAERLGTEFALTGVVHADPDIVAQLLDHPGMHIGSADAGAHITAFCGAGDTCYLFEKFVRTEKKMTLERAVQRLTSDLAKGWKIAERGEIRTGNFADLVIFDPDTIARGPERWINDLPDGGGRFTRNAVGIERVLVNGKTVVANGVYMDVLPGQLI